MSTDLECIHIVYGGTFFRLKKGLEVLAEAKSLKELEEEVSKSLDNEERYLIALDIFKTKNRFNLFQA